MPVDECGRPLNRSFWQRSMVTRRRQYARRLMGPRGDGDGDGDSDGSAAVPFVGLGRRRLRQGISLSGVESYALSSFDAESCLDDLCTSYQSSGRAPFIPYALDIAFGRPEATICEHSSAACVYS